MVRQAHHFQLLSAYGYIFDILMLVSDIGQKEITPLPHFKEFPPVPYWSATVTVPTPFRHALVESLNDSARSLDFTYSGFFTAPKASETAYSFTRYPRHRFGIKTDEQCASALSELTRGLRTRHIVHEVLVEEGRVGGVEQFRVLLGLQEGYDEGARTHDALEVTNALGSDFTVREVGIYSVGGWGTYEEPAVLISGDENRLRKVYLLANTFKQSRFTVNNLSKGEAYMVETDHCTDRDPMPSANK